MADVRSLLRAELASRRIKHPHVSYSSSGLAQCNICHLALKSDSLWEPHQRSKGHKLNLQKSQEPDTNNGKGHASKKRKADTDDEDDDEGRKKVKSAQESFADIDVRREGGTKDSLPVPAPATTVALGQSSTMNGQTASVLASVSESVSVQAPSAPSLPTDDPTQSTPPEPPQPQPQPTSTDPIDEDEWASFEREVVLPTHQPNPSTQTNPLTSSATIIAAPISAAELAAAEETGEPKRTKRDEEIENEKEDAARQLEEEFDQMEELEARVRKMRERREGIRRRGTVGEEESAVRSRIR